ncbi:MAG: hypothetical protein V3R99_13495 [Thermoguttaceae bacterium]
MSSEQQDTNPYASPQASTEPEISVGPQRFRWRLIPAGLQLAFGGTMVLVSIGLAVGICVMLVQKGTIEPLTHPTVLPLLLVIGIFGLSGSIWIYSAIVWWRHRWLRAVLTTILGYAICGGFFYWVNHSRNW